MRDPELEPEDLFRKFAERYFESGKREVPASWPEEVRDRCRFLLEVSDLGAAARAGAWDGALAGGALLEAPGGPAPHAGPPPAGAAPGPPAAAPGSQAAGKYAVEGEIGRGGMGRVLLAYDRDLRRQVAMKVMLGGDSGTESRFLAEAQATAQLEHPNICPVYELGVDASGKVFFTMKLVHGRTLKDVIRAGDASLTRRIQILEQVAMGVDFAHSRKVVHRDLKPANVMVGEYGEVLVMDWGLAKVGAGARTGDPARADAASGKVSIDRSAHGELTLEGGVQGSLAYMAPEQARGEVGSIDCRTDVFGLGAILYEILCGCPPYPEDDPRLALEQARRGDVVPPRTRAPHRDIPPALEALCLRCLAARKEDRPASAREVHDELQRYIEGIHDAERRAADVRRLAEGAVRHLGGYRAACDAARRLGLDRAARLAAVRDHDPEEAKRGLWSLEEKAEDARQRAAAELREATSAYHAILNVDPGDRSARAALADLYLERLEESEARGEREAAAVYAGLVAQYDDGRHAAHLRGDGELALDSSPSGAEATLYRYRERGRRLVDADREPLGATPLRRALPMGSYLAVLKLPGRREVRYPVLIDRCGVHEAAVSLYLEREIPPGFVHVPAGPAWVGGESDAFRPLPRDRAWIGDLFVGEHPVTLGEYCAFLNDPEGGGKGSREELLPCFGPDRYAVEGPGGELVPRTDPAWPVFAIPAAAALAYCRWLGRRIGRSVRLLTEVEWEKCARGADGRLYPWGNRFDWSFAKGGRSRKGEPYPESVGRFPADRSPYGIRDLAGCVRELTDGWFAEGHRACRGGSWFNGFEIVFRSDFRTPCREGNRVTDVGFRVAFGGAPGAGGGAP